jgi:thymidylate synthase
VQHRVAEELALPVGRLIMIVKSAHVYESEIAHLVGVLAGDDGRVP